MRRAPILPLLLGLVLGGCKNTEDHLHDIDSSQGTDGSLNLAVYDAGLLIHEGLTGIMDQDVLTLSQMGRAVHDCGKIVEKNEVALCRADAVSLLVHLALRYPLPPLDEPFLPEKAVGDTAIKQIEMLDKDSRLLEVETKIPLLTSPDKAVAERSHHDLRTLTGEGFPPDPKPWETWWESQRERVIGDVESKGREPLRVLAGLRYRSLSNARAVLGYLAQSLKIYDLTGLRGDMQRTILRLSRQVVVFSIQAALHDKDPAVRIAAARATQAVLDPSFGEALQAQIPRETDPDTKAQILSALRFYPGKATLTALLVALKDSERAVRIHARRILTDLAGQDLGPEPSPWLVWYEREGKTLWP